MRKTKGKNTTPTSKKKSPRFAGGFQCNTIEIVSEPGDPKRQAIVEAAEIDRACARAENSSYWKAAQQRGSNQDFKNPNDYKRPV